MTIMELGKRFKTIFGFNPPIDMIMTMIKGPTNAVIDIIKLDDEFAKHDGDYNPVECTYKGKPKYSMSIYISEKYGEQALEFIKNNMK